jgi:hypothetical protein
MLERQRRWPSQRRTGQTPLPSGLGCAAAVRLLRAAAAVAIIETDDTNVVAIGPRVRCRRPFASRTPSPLACPPRKRRCHSFLVERRRRSPTSGRHRCWPPGSPVLAHPREPPPPLQPNPWWRGGVFIVAAWDWITASAWVGSWALCT